MEDSRQHAETAGAKGWRCDQCPAVFGRLDHLKRHVATHKTERSHVCPFCGAIFGRGDVLRRHWKSCKTRIQNGQEIPEIQRGGKHKRACDGCANLRKACNGGNPCAECSHRSRPCTYQRLYEDDDANTSPRLNAQREALPHEQNLGIIEESNEQPLWNMGLQNYFPNTETGKRVYDHRKRFGL